MLRGQFTNSKRFIAPLLLGGIVFVLLASARVGQNDKRCGSVSIHITDEDEHQFITHTEVLNTLTNHGSEPLVGRKCSRIGLRMLEDRLRQNSFVKETQAWVNLEGELHVRLSQRIPLVRVYDPRGEAYYLDAEGEKMPLSPNYSARVPVATAQFSTPLHDTLLAQSCEKLHFLAQSLEADPFMKSLSGQILWYGNDEFGIYPRAGTFEILLGDTSALSNKFARLKAFYRNSLPQAGWDTYRTVSLKFRNQIVAHKR